jgi:uncharacterized Tic20 family protein
MHEECTCQSNDVQLWSSWNQRHLRVDGLCETKIDQRQLDNDGEEALNHQLCVTVMVIIVPDHEVGVTVDVSLKIKLYDLLGWVNLFWFVAAARFLFNERCLIVAMTMVMVVLMLFLFL